MGEKLGEEVPGSRILLVHCTSSNFPSMHFLMGQGTGQMTLTRIVQPRTDPDLITVKDIEEETLTVIQNMGCVLLIHHHNPIWNVV